MVRHGTPFEHFQQNAGAFPGNPLRNQAGIDLGQGVFLPFVLQAQQIEQHVQPLLDFPEFIEYFIPLFQLPKQDLQFSDVLFQGIPFRFFT